ncbi:hypothetical protein FHT97_004640 [Rhizobium sp. BK399]|nr:hypothetical protein [Rhizobium sp. BK399]
MDAEAPSHPTSGSSHREASLDYDRLHKLTLMITRDSGAFLRMFQNMVITV